jgi:GAF domain-containing protein
MSAERDRPNSIADRFAAAVGIDADAFPELELLPVRLTRACVQVLPVAGAGLSALANPDLRLPIGASDDVAGFVERLQFTYGEGPCLQAYRTGRPQMMTAPAVAERWPEMHRDLVAVTPYRAVASLPLFDGATRLGALDLYLEQPAGFDPADLADAFTVATCVSEALVSARVYSIDAQRTDPATRAFAHTDPMAGRIQVWKAMGLLNVQLEVTAQDALALLRARAYATERLVDDLAHDIVTRRIPVGDLQP